MNRRFLNKISRILVHQRDVYVLIRRARVELLEECKVSDDCGVDQRDGLIRTIVIDEPI